MVNNPAVLFCALVATVFIGTLIGAVILQLSCALYNRLAGLPGVPRPGLDRACGIVFLATLVNVPGTFIIFRLLRLAGQVSGYGFRGSLPIAAVALPMGILVLAGINTMLLPTSFGKGLLVSLLSHLLTLFLAAILAAFTFLIVLTFDLHYPGPIDARGGINLEFMILSASVSAGIVGSRRIDREPG